MRKLSGIFFLFFLISGCKEEVLVEPDPPVFKKPKINLTITPSGVIPYGAVGTIAWSSDSKDTKLNNISVKAPDSMNVQLFENTTYSLTATNGNISNNIEKVATVGDWTTSKLGLLTYKPWMLKSIKYLQNNKVVADVILDQKQKTDLFYFLLNGDVEARNSLGETDGGGNKWSFLEKGDETWIVGCLIFSLTKNQLILHEISLYYGNPAIIEIEYYHP